MENEFFNEELKNELITYINENGFDKLIHEVALKIDLKLIKLTNKIHHHYNKVHSFDKIDLKEFWDCFPYYFWNKYYLQNISWKILFEQYILEFGFENIKKDTQFKNNNIGIKLYKLRKEYVKSTLKQQKMINFWSCIPPNFWNEKDDKFKNLFSKFILNNGFEKLSYLISKNSDSKLGLKAYKIHREYKSSSTHKQMKLKKYWNCFPDGFWNNGYLKHIQCKILFKDFFKEHELYELTICTIYKNKYIGKKAYLLIKHYAMSMKYERALIRKYWDCFPKEFWKNKQLLSEKIILKNNFFIIKDKKAFYNAFSKMTNSSK